MATTVEQKPAVGAFARFRRAREGLSFTDVAVALTPFALALAIYLIVFAAMTPGTTGDEPHYLMVAQSIAFDGDVELTNDYASRERTLRVVNVWPLDPIYHAADYGSGGLRPLHGVGLSALLAPGVGLGGLTGARLIMVLIAALLAHQLYRLLAELGFRRRYRIAAWAAACFCLPVLPFSSQIYPELPGALIVVVVLRIIMRGGSSPWALALGSAASALLAWFHVRYLPISFALLLGLAYAATADRRVRSVVTTESRLRGAFRAARADLHARAELAARSWRTTAVPVLAPSAAVLTVFVLTFQYWYGSPDPRTPYYAFSTTNVGTGGWKFLYDFVLHDIFNPLAGWIPFVPVHWIGLAALGCLVVWFGWPAAACLAAAVGYELILASAGPSVGWGFPARYLLIFIPLIAVPIAVAIQQIRLARIVFVPLLLGSFVLAVAAVSNYQGLYPAGEKQRIVGLRSIATAFPVTRPPQPPTSIALVPGQALSQTGKVQGDRMVAKAGRDKRGFMLYGGYTTLKSGAYRASFSLSGAGAGDEDFVANIEVVGQGETVFAREVVRGRELRGRPNEFEVSFATPGEYLVEPRVYYHGRGTLTAGPIYVDRLEAPAPSGQFRDWPLAFLWVGGTVLIGALFVQVMNPPRPGRRDGPGASPDPPLAPETDTDGRAATTTPAAAAPAVAVPRVKVPAGPRPMSREWVLAQRGRLVALAALGGVCGIAVLSYWWTHAPLYNPTGTIDPWLYTALIVNFEEAYEHFGTTYYASRLPWIVPGRILYGLLPVDAAYWLFHGLAFIGGVTALFVLVRRYLGLAAAVVGAATLALTPMYWNAQYWDYIDGVTLTYLLGGLCFGLPLASGRLRDASLVAAGVFFAAAVTTNLFAVLVAVIYPILYAFLQPPTGLRQRAVAASRDVAALLVGAVALVVALGLYARANGGAFLYFEAQVHFVTSGTGTFKQPGYEWLRGEPRLLAPIFLLVVATPLLILGRGLPPFRFAAGSVAALAFLTASVYGWEFLAGGNVLELTYYFSYFAITIALTMASLAALAFSLARLRQPAGARLVAAATVAAVLALGLIYRDERAEWTGRSGMRITVVLMAVAALLVVGAVVGRRTRVGIPAVVAAAGAVAIASHFAINSSTGTFAFSYTAPNNRSLYHAAIDQVEFVNENHSAIPDDSLPAYWYQAANRPELIAIQSMYYFGYTVIDLDLPRVGKQMRERLASWNPQTIMMLCDTHACGGATTALRRAGHPYAEVSAKLISRGKIRLWAVLLEKSANA